MTTDDLLWNAQFEANTDCTTDAYDYDEERSMERYYQNKELLEQLGNYFRPAC